MTEYDLTGPFKIGDQILGDLEVTGFLGMGGQAYVYECIDRYMDAAIAVKVIPNVPGRGKELLVRARSEAKLLFKLNHPNVVRVMTARPVGEKMVCIVMEKLEGLSLRQFLHLHKRLTVTEALLIVRQIASGVGAAHRLNVIHRDLKPENVFVLPPDNQVKVLDFGIAKFLGQGQVTTNRFRIHGTPLYMSPEHIQGNTITHLSDIYELGVVAFELMTGQIPCLVDADNPDYNQMAILQIMKVTPPVSQLIRDVGPRTEQLVKRATAKDPSQRYASMQEVIAAIDEALIEQKTLFPREADNIRYVDEEMMRAVKLAEEALDAEDNHGTQAEPPIVAPAPREVVKAKPVVMAPTVELAKPPPKAPPPAPTPRAAPVVPATAPSPSVSSLNLYATREPSKKSSRFRLPLPFVLAPIILGLGISVAISLPDILRARANRAALASEATGSVEISAVVAPKTTSEVPESLRRVTEAPTKPSASVVAHAVPVKTKPAPKPATKTNTSWLTDDVPTVTKAELDRMRAREKALAADLDKETAARKARAVKP